MHQPRENCPPCSRRPPRHCQESICRCTPRRPLWRSRWETRSRSRKGRRLRRWSVFKGLAEMYATRATWVASEEEIVAHPVIRFQNVRKGLDESHQIEVHFLVLKATTSVVTNNNRTSVLLKASPRDVRRVGRPPLNPTHHSLRRHPFRCHSCWKSQPKPRTRHSRSLRCFRW